jgi:predicted CoA-substrate-specific enzyme activase
MIMFTGIDIGSTSTKVVVMDAQGNMAHHIVPSGNNFSIGYEKALSKALDTLNGTLKDIVATVTTGYGRHIAKIESEPVTEITCVAKGASFLDSGTRTIIDIGGQDTKAISIDDHGNLINFALNDKCAAGTGRFLEAIAASLGLTLDTFAKISLKSPTILPISNTCTVFAETEVISRLSEGESTDGIARGIHHSLASKIYSLAKRIKIREKILVCGGGALNKGLTRELRDQFGTMGDAIIYPDNLDPRLVPAIGAALIAKEHYSAS